MLEIHARGTDSVNTLVQSNTYARVDDKGLWICVVVLHTLDWARQMHKLGCYAWSSVCECCNRIYAFL